MKTRSLFLTGLSCAVSALSLILSPSAQAGYIVTLQQVGPDVVANGTGAIDLTGLTFQLNAALLFARVAPNGPNFIIDTGPVTFTNAAVYTGLTGPTSFGPGFFTNASSGSGDFVGIHGGAPIGTELLVPVGYMSNNPLSDTSTYAGQTFATLGVTPGTYEWTWGTGVNQNFTLQIGTATVPDTGSTLGLLALALAGLFGAAKFRAHQLA